MILLAVFGSLRWGELAALRPEDIDLKARTLRVQRQLTETSRGGLAFGPPKSDAGLRTVPLPSVVLGDLTSHLAVFAQVGDDGLIFTSPEGMPLRHGNFYRRAWLPAVREAA